MKRVAQYLRIGEWMSSKVIMMLGALAYFVCLSDIEMAGAVRQLVVYFLFLSMFLAISYVVNDLSDLESDRKAGKQKVIAGLPRRVVWISLGAMLLAGDVPIMAVAYDKTACLLLIAITTFLGLAYSVPGIRFKEKGAWGLVECSFAQRCMPLTLILLFIERNRTNILLWVLWFLLSFLNGIRYILIHQYIDRENDRASGTHTFVLDRQVGIRQWILYCCVAEFVCCAALLIPLMRDYAPVVVVGVLASLVLEYCICQVLNVMAKKDWLVSFDSVPLELFYNIVFPLCLGICMMKKSVWAALFCAFTFICTFRSFKVKLGIAMVYIRRKKP